MAADLTMRDRPLRGVLVEADGNDLIVPPLQMQFYLEGQRSGFLDRIAGASTAGGLAPELMAEAFGFILNALRRNYPRLTAEDMPLLIDAYNLPLFLGAINAQGTRTNGVHPPGEVPSPSAP